LSQVNLKEEIKKLIQLQAIDTRIYALIEEKEAKPKQIQALEQEFEVKKEKVLSLEKRLQGLQREKKEQELNLSSKEEGIKKSQSQLYQLKTNKEYSAMLKEIEGMKADASRLEDKILVCFEQIDELKNYIEQQRQSLQQEEEKLNIEKDKIRSRIEEINQILNELKMQRQRAATVIAPRILSQYERILSGREGKALVEVRDNACQGCFMNVPAQVINLIKMYDTLVTCEVCQRILYIKEENAQY
jgi:hypothetical protein